MSYLEHSSLLSTLVLIILPAAMQLLCAMPGYHSKFAYVRYFIASDGRLRSTDEFELYNLKLIPANSLSQSYLMLSLGRADI